MGRKAVKMEEAVGTEFRGKMSTLSCTVIRRRKPNGEQGNNMGDNEPKKKRKKL